MSPTLKDVAEKAGVAKSTVSFVLNNKPYVTDKTKQKVLDAISVLNYQPNEIARKLGNREFNSEKTGCIGFISCGIPISPTHTYYGNILNGISRQVQEIGYRLLYASTPKSESFYPNGINRNHVDGMILTGRPTREFVEQLIRDDLPFVLADFRLSDLDCNIVCPDNINGIQKAVKYLYKLGHRKIVYISGDMGHSATLEKLNGFKIAMDEFSLSYKNRTVIKEFSPQGGIDGYKEFVDKKISFTAVVSANDSIATGVYKAAAEAGLRIPEDISVTGYDNVELAEHLEPGLTTVAVDLEEIGKKAVERLFTIIDRKEDPLAIRVMTKLCIRDSCCKR